MAVYKKGYQEAGTITMLNKNLCDKMELLPLKKYQITFNGHYKICIN